MASQNINVGTTANDGTGESLRSAFIDIRKMFAEIYGQTYTSDTQDLSGATLAIKENQLSVTNSPTDGYVLTYDNASGGFTWEQKFDGDITGIVAGDGLTGSSLDSGDATLNVNVDDSTIEIATDTVQVKDLGISTAKIANDGVTHEKLEGRYTAIQDIATTSGTINLDASTYAAFNLTGALGTATLNVQNIKTGQVIDIILSGSLASAVLTLSASTFTTVAINKVGSTSLDTAATNIIQVLCVDDTDADAILTWAVASYASGTSV